MNENVLEIKEITKTYPGVLALDSVSFDIKRNTVHCIVGENGAGKSTFIKVLTGAIKRNSGNIILNGNEYNPKNIRDAMDAGVSVLFQELNVVNQLTVEQNLTLGIEESRFGIIKKSTESEKVFEVLKAIDPTISLKQKVSELSVAKKQIIEIAKAVATEASIIIMDEPTAAISEEEVKRLFKVIQDLKNRHVTVIYISHRLDEIFEIGKYVTVLRDGKVIGTKALCEISSKNELIKMMLGKVVVQSYIPSKIDYNNKILEAKSLTNSKIKNINFDLYKGEILGFYGLVGSGKTEIARAIYGADKKEGKVLLNGSEVKIIRPKQAIKNGIAMVPEERRTEGLFTSLPIRENIPIMNVKKISSLYITNRRKEKEIAKKYVEKMKIVTNSIEKVVSLLSGGNQQKVVVSKCLNADSSILLLDEPTRGVDIGAKEEIHNIIRELSKEGVSVIVFSSELPEILNLCDRIVLLYGGKIKAVLQNEKDVNSEQIMHIATGGEADL